MRTISDIKSEIEDLKKEIVDIREHEPSKSKAKRRENIVSEKIRYRNMIIMYLETDPSEDFVKGQYAKLQKDQQIIEDRYEDWKYNSFVAEKGNNPRVKYDEISGLTEIKRNLKTLKYILNI